MLTCPDGSKVDLKGKTSPYTDENTYLLTSNKTWTLTATRADGNKETVQKTATMTYGYAVYHGKGFKKDTAAASFKEEQSGAIDGDFITSRLSKTSPTNTMLRNLSFSMPENQYLYYAIPEALHTKTPKFDEEGNPFTWAFNLVKKVTVIKNETSIVYYVYRSSTPVKVRTDVKLIVS